MAPLKFLIVVTSAAAALAVGLGVQLQADDSDLMAMIINALGGIG